MSRTWCRSAKAKRATPTAYGCQGRVSIDRQCVIITHTEYARNIADAETLPDPSGVGARCLASRPRKWPGTGGFTIRKLTGHGWGLRGSRT